MRPTASVVVVLLVAATFASAGELRKCVDRRGQSSFVSAACPGGTREVWMRGVTAEQEPADAALRRQAELARWQQRTRAEAAAYRGEGNRASRIDSGGPTQSQQRDQRCSVAKRQRDDTRDRSWRRMTIEWMRKLDEAVAQACR